METYPWDEFYNNHCDKEFIDEMIEEEVGFELNGDVADWEFADAMYTLSDFNYQNWLLDHLIDAGMILHASYIQLLYEQLGECEILYKMIDLYKGSFSPIFIADLIDSYDGELLDLVIYRYDGAITGEQLVSMISYCDVRNETIDLAFDKCKERLSADQIRAILDNCDEIFYPRVQNLMKGLSFRDRVRIRDDYF